VKKHKNLKLKVGSFICNQNAKRRYISCFNTINRCQIDIGHEGKATVVGQNWHNMMNDKVEKRIKGLANEQMNEPWTGDGGSI
jgi:hypothetical protein